VADQLKRYSLPPQQYAVHRQSQVRNVAQDTRRVDEMGAEQARVFVTQLRRAYEYE
jgi:predicted metallo-beta-lactamase superfamily hydrolase